jgi:uncharacterized protein YbbK (DUF523 family)
MMHRILVSRCLLGHLVRYDGGASGPFDQLLAWQAEGRVVGLCPEVAGGLPTPRPPAEIAGGQGNDVLAGVALRGAEIALEQVREHGIRIAVLKANSPSCGNRQTYDGSFSASRVAGQGVTAALLMREGVQVFNEHELAAAAEALSRLPA